MKTHKAILLTPLLLLCTVAWSQSVYMTRNGKISFFSKTALENIDAVNNDVFSALDIQKGDIAFAVLIKSFHFEKSLMEEHFNENYMESTQFPKSTFNGKIDNLPEVNFQKDGKYPVKVTGDLVMHGVTQHVTIPGEISVEGGKISATSKFQVKLVDYKIKVPSVVSEKIAEVIDISIECHYEPKSK